MTDTDLDFVTIADLDWPLADADTAVELVGDAMFQMSISADVEEMTRIQRKWEREVKLAERRRVEAPEMPQRLNELITKVNATVWRSTLAMLDLRDDDSDDPDDERLSKTDFVEAVGEWYREQNGGPMTSEDLEKVTEAIRDAWAARAEARSALPSEPSSGSADGHSPGKSAPASKRQPASRSKPSR
jgi:hypothetical protein